MKRIFIIGLLLVSFIACETTQNTTTESSVPSSDIMEQVYNYKIKMAVSYIESGDFKKALLELYRAQEAKETPEVYNLMGVAYLGLGEMEKAKEALDTALKMDPNFSEAWVNLSAYYLAKGMWKEAIKACNKALENKFYSRPEVAFTNLAEAYFMLGDYDKAIDYLKKAVKYNVYYAPAYEKIIGYFLAKGEVIMAKGYLDDAKAVGLKTPGLIFFEGIFALRDGDVAKAKKLFQSILVNYPLSRWADKAKEYLDAMR